MLLLVHRTCRKKEIKNFGATTQMYMRLENGYFKKGMTRLKCKARNKFKLKLMCKSNLEAGISHNIGNLLHCTPMSATHKHPADALVELQASPPPASSLSELSTETSRTVQLDFCEEKTQYTVVPLLVATLNRGHAL